MRYELKAIGIWSFVKVFFFFNLVLGFLGGLLVAAFSGLLMAAAGGLPGYDPDLFGGSAGPSSAFLIALPFFYSIAGAVFGTVFGAVGAGIYNLLAKLLGGLELTLDRVELVPAPPRYPAPYPSPAPPAEPTAPRPPAVDNSHEPQSGESFPRR